LSGEEHSRHHEFHKSLFYWPSLSSYETGVRSDLRFFINCRFTCRAAARMAGGWESTQLGGRGTKNQANINGWRVIRGRHAHCDVPMLPTNEKKLQSGNLADGSFFSCLHCRSATNFISAADVVAIAAAAAAFSDHNGKPICSA
jgi:hypothetical protein